MLHLRPLVARQGLLFSHRPVLGVAGARQLGTIEYLFVKVRRQGWFDS